MKRLIEFKYQDGNYILEENGANVFGIKVSDLKFNSLDFYNGIYKGKSPNIELVNKLVSDSYKKGEYIFKWLSDIVSGIANEFPDLISEDKDEDEKTTTRLIRLFDFATCAGDGFFVDVNVPYKEIEDITGEADFAVNISGDSMEPNIKDKSIAYIKKVEELQHKDIGLFVVNGNVMCKRYIKKGKGAELVPDNNNHETIRKKDVYSFKILGKVII